MKSVLWETLFLVLLLVASNTQLDKVNTVAHVFVYFNISEHQNAPVEYGLPSSVNITCFNVESVLGVKSHGKTDAFYMAAVVLATRHKKSEIYAFLNIVACKEVRFNTGIPGRRPKHRYLFEVMVIV